MRTILYVILLLVLGNWMLSSCYKDEGNYDYHEINEVTIGVKGFVDTTYNVTAFVDTISIKPEITFKLEDNKNLIYEWKLISANIGNRKEYDLGNSHELFFPVELTAGNYSLYFKITDTVNTVEYLKMTSVVVQNIQSSGWIVLGENDEGFIQMDMVSTVNDTIVLKNILKDSGLPPLKKPVYLWVIDNYSKNMTHVSTEDGTYRIGREDFVGGENTHYRYAFYDPTVVDEFVLKDGIQVRGYQRIAVVGNDLFHIGSLISGEIFGQPANHYKGNYDFFAIGDKIGANFKSRAQSFVVYNDTDKRFCKIGGTGMGATDGYCDSLSDTKTDAALFSWKTGLDYVTTINSFFLNGHTYTILKDAENSKYYLYSFFFDKPYWGKGNSFRKQGYYDLVICPEFENARFFGASALRTFLIYATDSKLYAYDFQSGKSKLIKDFGTHEITCMYYDLILETRADCFYIASYDPSLPASTGGTITKFKVNNDPNDISIEAIPESTWTGLCKIKSIQYKRRYGF